MRIHILMLESGTPPSLLLSYFSMFGTKHMGIRYSSILILGLILVSCNSNVANQHSQQEDSPPGPQGLLDDASEFAEEILGDLLRVHFTEYKRGELGVDALFESEGLIGYTTFANARYQKVASPVDLEDCILFAGKYKSQKDAESAFHFLKASSAIPASEVEGMVGPTPVQVRFLDKLRNDGERGMFTQQGSYVFFLTENGDLPPIAEDWKDYEEFFHASICGSDESLETIRLREGR